MDLTAKTRAAVERLHRVVAAHSPAALASSFGAEDMVLMDMIAGADLNIEVFTLDTGRLPAQTHRLIHEARRRYGREVRLFCPDTAEIESYLRANGPDAFYDGVTQRLECCAIRKVAPLRRALAGRRAWITGLRREQSPTRRDLPLSEWDDGNGLHKFNPLAEWSTAEVWAYIERFEVPCNALHAEGYASIGCAPCTRAVAPGEDIRAGRWWWEDPCSKECGLHVNKEKVA